MIKLLFPLCLVACWQLLASYFNVYYFPSLGQIFDAFWKTVTTSDELTVDMMSSFWRLSIGLLISIPMSIALGTLIGINKTAKSLLIGSVNYLRSMPITALAPLIIMTFGITDAAAVAIVFIASAVPTLVITIDSVEMTVDKFRPLIQNFELPWWKAIGSVILPGASPGILTGIDLSINSAFKMLIVAELFGSSSGLGFRLMDSSHYLDFSKAYYLLIVIGFLGLAIASITSYSRQKLLKWV